MKWVGEKGEINRTPLSDGIDDFYMSDSISRHSEVMARCSKELNPMKVFNFKEKVQTWLSH